MSKIGNIAKEYKEKVESIKREDYNTRYNEHYEKVMIAHLRELDNAYNKCITEMKQKLNDEKANYIKEQQAIIESDVNAEYSSFYDLINSFIDKN